MPAAYLIGTFDVHDWDRYNEYITRGYDTLEGIDVVGLVDTNEPHVLEGEWFGPRTIVLKFASSEIAMNWYRSEKYQKVAELRRAAAESRLILVEGAE